MVVTVVHVRVVRGSAEVFVAATLENHRHSIEEPGNLRFDVLASVDDPEAFLLYEGVTLVIPTIIAAIYFWRRRGEWW